MIRPSQAGQRLMCLCPRKVVWAVLVPLLALHPLAASDSAVSTQNLYPEATISLASLVSEMDVASAPELVAAASADSTNSPAPTASHSESTSPPVPVPAPRQPINIKPDANSLPAGVADLFTLTNDLPRDMLSDSELVAHLNRRLEIARYLRARRQANDAEPILIELMGDRSSDSIRQNALLELAAAAQDQNELPRAQQIYAQFLSKWANDARVPEVLLRQGMLYRQMGLYNLAFTKFYAVMTSALALKSDQLDYYARLVQEAQMQIAETHYDLGKYTEAADFFSRLLKQNSATINKAQLLYRLTRCHAALGQYAEAISDAQDFLNRFPEAPEQPEIRFHLALALKELGRNNESLHQVLLLLREQREQTRSRPEVWTYWQQRTGNLIANQLYHERDYAKALEIYVSLAQLDSSYAWQVPLNYQIGITYEHLWQPQKAVDTYKEILSHEQELNINGAPGLKAILDMARWRIKFIDWQSKAEAANRQLQFAATNTSVTASLPARSAIVP